MKSKLLNASLIPGSKAPLHPLPIHKKGEKGYIGVDFDLLPRAIILSLEEGGWGGVRGFRSFAGLRFIDLPTVAPVACVVFRDAKEVFLLALQVGYQLSAGKNRWHVEHE